MGGSTTASAAATVAVASTTADAAKQKQHQQAAVVVAADDGKATPPSPTGRPASSSSQSSDLDRAYRRAMLATAPLFAAIVAISAIDRNNLSYASISWLPAIGLTPSQYGLGTSLFYATYTLGLVPFGLLAPHVGARRMLAALLVAWGAVAACMALVRGPGTFYLLRLLLGACESGAMPAMWHHLSKFFTKDRITKPFGFLYAGVALSGIVGAPLAVGLLALDGRGGLPGYKWLFVLEGIPAALLGLLVFLLLPDEPRDVRGLTPQEAEALQADLKQEAAEDDSRRSLGLRGSWRLVASVLCTRFTPLMAVITFVSGFVSSIFVFWAPLIVQSLITGRALGPEAAKGSSARGSLPAVGLSTVPYAVGAVTVLLAAAHAQRKKELFAHGAVPLFAGGVLTALFPVLTRAHPAVGFVALCATLACSLAANPSVTSILTLMNKGPQQSVAMPVYDSIMHLGAILGSPVAGVIVQRSGGGFTWVTIVMGILIMVAAALVAVLGVWVAHTDKAEQVLLRRRRRGRVVDGGGVDGVGGGDGVV